jgi:hypothetical protein
MQGTSWWKGQKNLNPIMTDNRAEAKFLRHLLRPAVRASVVQRHRDKAQLLNSCTLMAMACRPTA